MDDKHSPTWIASYIVSGVGFLGGGVDPEVRDQRPWADHRSPLVVQRGCWHSGWGGVWVVWGRWHAVRSDCAGRSPSACQLG